MKFESKKGWLVVVLLSHTFIVLLTVTVINTSYIPGFKPILTMDIDRLAVFFLVLSAVLGMVSLKVAIEIIRLLEVEAEAQIQEIRLENMGEFNLALREQRHDFLNHLQVISGFIQIKKQDKAKEYLLGLSESLMLNDEKEITLDSEVGMLIYSKKVLAARLHICWQQELEINLDAMSIPRIELVRVLGNLLDNAIYELKQVSLDKRRLLLKAKQQGTEAVITVTNYGTVINDKIAKHVFAPGFTTKETDGDGMGLYIVKSLVEKWGGRVSIFSNEKENCTAVAIYSPVNGNAKDS